MTSFKTNQFSKEQNIKEKNYQLNMEILTSLKSLPGKVVNLQSEKIIFNNDGINKKVIFPEEKFTTSSSISKELLCDPFLTYEEKVHKKSYTTNSVFKPIAYYPKKKTTLNFYNFGSMMSYSDFLVPNPTPINPLKITNSSYSKNSFYHMGNLDGNVMNSANNVNPNFNPITINNINTFNGINPIIPFFPNFTQNPLINEQISKKNTLTLTKNNIFLNKKRNPESDINLNLNTKEKELNDIIINNKNKNNLPKPKSTFFLIKQTQTQKIENPTKKILFTVIPKSSYIYRKRKPRKKRLLNGIRNKIKCSHEGCEGVFKTKKQLIYHHYKMNIECHNDIINLLKMIYSTKTILLQKSEKKEEISQKYGNLYRETMKKISLDEHIETIVGVNFEDEIIEK